MSAITDILTLFHKIAVRRQIRQSLGQLLARPDDHLLDDIGLTRLAAEGLLADPSAIDPARAHLRMAAFTPAAAFGAGFFRWVTSGSSRPM